VFFVTFDASGAKKMDRGAWRRLNAGAGEVESKPRYIRPAPSDHLSLDHAAPDPFRRQYREILGFVRRRVDSDEEAEEVVQEVFATAAESLAHSADGSPPTLAWLYTVARRRVVGETRRRRRADLVSLELVGEAGAEEGYGEAVRRALDESLAAMSEGQRQVVVLRLIEGRSFKEIADRVGVTEEACRMRFMRGLEQLRNDFEKEGLGP
jgi:RNA polymerase sigma-70 factor (ECF subfamily)